MTTRTWWAAATAAALAASGLGLAAPAAQAVGGTTFHVTSTVACDGAGTFEQAILDANANPGRDTVVFDLPAGSVIDIGSCDRRVPGYLYGVNATESVDIQGNGVTIIGTGVWVDGNGAVNDPQKCPGELGSQATLLSLATGFLLVGRDGQDSRDVSVTLADVHFKTMPHLVETIGGASFTLTDSVATGTVATWDCDRSPIQAVGGGGSIVVARSTFEQGAIPGARSLSGVINAENTDVTLDHVTMAINAYSRAVTLLGGSLTVVGSQFIGSGGLYLDGDATIVNSAFYSSVDKAVDNIAVVSGTTTVRASSFYWIDPTCTECSSPGHGFRTVRTGQVVFESSAIGTGNVIPGGGPLLDGVDGSFSSDALTWVQPTPNQDAGALATLLPDALTAAPGLPADAFLNTPWVQTVTPMLGTELDPGVLVDAVPDAAPGGANELLNPIDSSTITTDVFGHPRYDVGDDRRSIGAVEVVETARLMVLAVSSQTVELAWNRPADPGSGPLTGYAVLHRPLTSPPGGAWTRVDVAGASTLTLSVTGLTNGTEYEFVVVPVNAVGDGPQSTAVTALPLGPVEVPVPTASPGNAQVTVSWPEPSLGGRPGPAAYQVVYRPVGSTTWSNGPGWLSGRTTTIPDLTNGVRYELGVMATAADGTSSITVGTTTATPLGPVGTPVVAITTGSHTLVATWARPSMGGRTFDHYVVRWTPAGGTTRTVSRTTGRLSLTGLTNGVSYRVCVTAYAADGTHGSAGCSSATPRYGAVVTRTTRVYYLPLGTVLSSTQKARIDAMIAALPKGKRIEGFAVKGWVQRSGDARNDYILSYSRAAAVKNYLRAKGFTVPITLSAGGSESTSGASRAADVTVKYRA